jgi:hypothetical protein
MGETANFTIEGRRLSVLPDPLKEWSWELFIPNLGSLIRGVDDEDFVLRCRSATIPSGGLESYEANYMGFKKIIPIKKKMVNSISTELEEFEDQKVLSMIYSWMNIIFNQDPKNLTVGHTNPTMLFRNGYTRNMTLKMYSGTGKILKKKIVFHNTFPSNISEANLTYGGSSGVKFSVEWSFDYWTLD